MYDHDSRCIAESVTPDSISGRPFGADVPVYIVISNRTGSTSVADGRFDSMHRLARRLYNGYDSDTESMALRALIGGRSNT
jgi:hypothetical protein